MVIGARSFVNDWSFISRTVSWSDIGCLISSLVRAWNRRWYVWRRRG